MPMLEWNEGLSIQVAEVDAQHKELVTLLNQLYDSMRQQDEEKVLLGIVDKMQQYSVTHFTTEEKHMELYNFPDMAEHKKIHQDFIDKVESVRGACARGEAAISMDVLNFLSSWVVEHIHDTDKKLGEFLNQQGVS